MYDRFYPGRTGLKKRFVDGVEEFVHLAMRQTVVTQEGRIERVVTQQGGIRCPCLKCRFRKIKSDDEVRLDLYSHGFLPNYWIWSRHGEVAAGVLAPVVDNNIPVQAVEGHTSSPVAVAAPSSSNQTTTGYGLVDVVQGMISDAVGVNLDFEEPQYYAEEVPNEEAQLFYTYLNEINKPLFEGSKDSKLSMCVWPNATQARIIILFHAKIDN